MASLMQNRTPIVEEDSDISTVEESHLTTKSEAATEQNEDVYRDYPVTLVLAALGAW